MLFRSAEIKVDEEKALKWLQNGAEPTDTVRDLLKKEGILEKFHFTRQTKKEDK